MFRVGVSVCVLVCSTSLAWSQAAQPVVPVIGGLVVSGTNPLPITGSISVPSPLDTNSTIFIGGSPVTVVNPFFSSPVVAGAVVSSTNPLPENVFVGGSLVSFANPFPSGVSIGGVAVSTANPFPEVPIIAGAAVSSANPLPEVPTIGGAPVSNANPLAIKSIIGGAPLSTTNPTPIAGNLGVQTYAAATVGFSRATAGDLFCVTGSASKTVKVRQINVSATTGTIVTTDVSIVLRSTLDTGGTPTTLTNTAFNSNNAASTAVVTIYATAPTTGTLIGTISANKYTALTTNANQLGIIDNLFSFNKIYDQSLTLNGATQAACVVVGAVNSGNWNVDVFWSEE